MLAAQTRVTLDPVQDFGNRPGRQLLAFAGTSALLAAISIADYLSGFDIRLATLYLFPIALASWRLGLGAGTFTAATAAGVWIASFATNHPYMSDAHFYSEGVTKGVTYIFIAWLVARLRTALAQADQRFVTVLDGLTAEVFVEDPRDGALLFTNARYRSKFGAGRPAALPADLPADFAGELHDAQGEAWYLVRSRPLRWVDGREVVLRLVSDITEEKRVRELLERHRDAMHRGARLAALGEFASALAHELNQPLAAIATYNNSCLRLLAAGRADDPELAEAMRKCRDQAKRAGDIIHRLREFLRQRSPALADDDLNAAALDVLRAVEGDAARAGVALQFEPAQDLPSVRMDRVLIEQVVLNLVRNAIEAVHLAPAERRVVTVSTARDGGGSVRLAVADRGAGVAAELRERLFEAFASDKPGGLGLGLSICRSIVEAHGGHISYDACREGGARFGFSLPGAIP